MARGARAAAELTPQSHDFDLVTCLINDFNTEEEP